MRDLEGQVQRFEGDYEQLQHRRDLGHHEENEPSKMINSIQLIMSI